MLYGPEPDVAEDAGHADAPPRMGFFTDTSICIGCKACEVACKEWNRVPEDGLNFTGMSYDNTVGPRRRHLAARQVHRAAQVAGQQLRRPADADPGRPRHAERSPSRASSSRRDRRTEFRWLMASDVCKHCTHAACLDVCPTGALIRTEFGTVVVQEDVCNGCGYCVPACPYGVIDKREDDGRVWKCTLCYDRLGNGQEPACAKACPTESIQFGPLDELRVRAAGAGRAAARGRGHRRPALRREPRRRRRRRRRVLPAARQARGVRAAAGPDRHHPRPAARCGGTPASRRPRSLPASALCFGGRRR